jgi:hypothetical protein
METKLGAVSEFRRSERISLLEIVGRLKADQAKKFT